VAVLSIIIVEAAAQAGAIMVVAAAGIMGTAVMDTADSWAKHTQQIIRK
jgi:hypothetical protein